MYDEYISKEDAANFAITLCRLGIATHENTIRKWAHDLRSANVAPVVVAHWIREPNTSVCKCSNCEGISLLTTKYCGNCGARMDKVYIEVELDELKETTNGNLGIQEANSD